ncbi:MAG TPA: histidine phosphatase family protein [Terriglobales bacterium]|nr:histidine phosphatase family protein [Terriglobales bacterium]
MTLYIVRHASAGESKKDPAKDAKRALDRSGIAQAMHMGRVLANLETQLDAVLTSPLKRAAQTAALVANEMGFEGKLRPEPALAPDGSYAAFQQLLARNAGHEAVLVVGHNPNLSLFLGRLVAGPGAPARIELRKGAAARVRAQPGQAGAVLEWLLTPKVVVNAKL